MRVVLCCLLLSIIESSWFTKENRSFVSLANSQCRLTSLDFAHRVQFSQELVFNVYKFTVNAPDSGRVREVIIKAYRGQLLLTNFRVKVDGAAVGAEVADLDNNRFPELYVYSTSVGSGSFGRVYGWQFLPERKADITPKNWLPPPVPGYMGHDSLWLEPGILCRKYPIYQPGNANAEPSGGFNTMRYKLKPAGTGFVLEE